jgi:excisionase family DNA binding protein
MPATITRRLVSLADAADTLAVSTRTVRRYIAEGQIEAVRLGRKTLRIKVDSIERFIDAVASRRVVYDVVTGSCP